MRNADPSREVALASRILFGTGVVDAFGHASRRHPTRPDRFLMSCSKAPGLVTPGDIVEHDLDGQAADGADHPLFLERFIHAEIYRSREDISGIVHSHAPSVIPFTVVGAPVRPVAHTCGFLGGLGLPFDVADHEGDGSDLLVRDGRLGRALAEHLGEANVVLMRGHGFTSVGASLPEAVFRAVYTALNCQLQSASMALGTPRYLSAAEAIACERTSRPQVARAWTLWASQFGDLLLD